MSGNLSDLLLALKSRKIFFGHQSVGENIMAGVRKLSANATQGLTICDTENSLDRDEEGWFYHCKIGENFSPKAKDADFSEIVRRLAAKGLQAALYKYCYVDVDHRGDVDQVLEGYLTTLQHLKTDFPDIRFFACTVPLTIVQRGPRAWVKRILNRPLGGYADNMARNQYNRLLREACAGNFDLVDIARFEADTGTGKKCTFRSGSEENESLCEKYARDGRHLNIVGAEHVGRALLEALNSAL